MDNEGERKREICHGPFFIHIPAFGKAAKIIKHTIRVYL